MSEKAKKDKDPEKLRVGVFICDCGSNIAGHLDCPAVTEYASTLPGVVFTKENLYTCSEAGILEIQKAIKEKYGLQSQVGWNMHNGVLTQVTVSFDAEKVRDKKVSELEAAAKDAVVSSFKSKPKVLNVQIACKITD